jgi:hypothetical protein
MKVLVQPTVDSTPTKYLELLQNEHEVVVQDEDHYSIVTFRVSDKNKLVLVRNSLPTNTNIATDKEGRIIEVDE